MLKLKLWPPDVKGQLTGKDPDAGKVWGQEKKGATEDEMVGWHHWINGHEFEQTQGDSGGQGSLGAAVHGVARSQTQLSDWMTRLWFKEGLRLFDRLSIQLDLSPYQQLHCFAFLPLVCSEHNFSFPSRIFSLYSQLVWLAEKARLSAYLSFLPAFLIKLNYF